MILTTLNGGYTGSLRLGVIKRISITRTLCWQSRPTLYVSIPTKDPRQYRVAHVCCRRQFESVVLQLKQSGCGVQVWCGVRTPPFCFNDATVVGSIPLFSLPIIIRLQESKIIGVGSISDALISLYRLIVSFITCANSETKILNLKNNKNNRRGNKYRMMMMMILLWPNSHRNPHWNGKKLSAT